MKYSTFWIITIEDSAPFLDQYFKCNNKQVCVTDQLSYTKGQVSIEAYLCHWNTASDKISDSILNTDHKGFNNGHQPEGL